MQKRIALFLIMALMLTRAAFATDWRQIRTFDGKGTSGIKTDTFNVPGSEWRIDWSYVPVMQTQGSTSTFFSVLAYPENETGTPVAEILQSGSNQTSGTSYVHQGRGDHYLKIDVVNTQSYAITVWYDADSVAEGIDPSLVVAIVLIVILITVAITVIFKRRKK